MSAVEKTEHVRYLGCTLVVGTRTVEVYAPDGRHVGTAYSVSGGRRIARGYRRAA